MKKIIILCLSIFMLISCGKKEYENLSKRDMLLIDYSAYKLINKEAIQTEKSVINYLEYMAEEKNDKNAQEQLDLWYKVKEQVSGIKYTNYKPTLKEIFGGKDVIVDYYYRLYQSGEVDDKTEIPIMNDIVTDTPFEGIAVIRNVSNGTPIDVYRYEKGLPVEPLMTTTFYTYYWYDPPIKSRRYYKGGKVYKERFYKENGDFMEEKIY